MKTFFKRLFALILSLLLLPLPTAGAELFAFHAGAAQPRVHDYVTTVYEASGTLQASFGWLPEEFQPYSYALPQLSDALPCAQELNEKIRSLFNLYITDEGNSVQYLHDGDRILDFMGPLSSDMLWDFSSESVLLRFEWTADLYDGRILSLLIRTVHYEDGGFLLQESGRAFTIDLQSGRALSGAELLAALGLNEESFYGEASDVLRVYCHREWEAMEPEDYPGRAQDIQYAQEYTVSLNRLQQLYERGLYLDASGALACYCTIDNGSKYLSDSLLTLHSGTQDAGEYRIGTAYCSFAVPDYWRGHVTVLEHAPGVFSLYNTDNLDAGFDGFLMTVYVSAQIQSAQQLLDYALDQGGETAAENTYYLAPWSGGLIYGIAAFDMPYNLDDPNLSAIYISMYRDLSELRRTVAVDKEVIAQFRSEIIW